MEFSHADQFCMSSDTCRPKKLGRVCGVDMAWELGLLTQKPELEFPEAHKDYVKDMKKYLKEDNELYQQFNKYQNLISEAFGNYKPKQLKGTSYVYKVIALMYGYTCISIHVCHI